MKDGSSMADQSSAVETTATASNVAVQTECVPDFIGIGAQRAGTSWMYQCLFRHPEVFMPRKEIQFFNAKYDRGFPWYQEHFRTLPEGRSISGEFTPNYLADEQAVPRMAEHVPNAKLVVILREPVARAYSAYNLMVSHGHYTGVNFEEAMKPGSHLVNGGLYGKHLERVFRFYPKDHVKIFLYEQIDQNPEQVLRELYEYIGVDPDFVPDSVRRKYNMSGFSRAQKFFRLPQLQKALLRSVLRPIFCRLTNSRAANLIRNRLFRNQTEQRAKLAQQNGFKAYFRDDIKQLQDLIGRDLTHWL